MSFNPWTFTVLGLLLVSLVRPVVATLLQRHSARAMRRRYNATRAGGGATMLVMAAYLVSGASWSAAPAFWDLMGDALHDSFVRSLPVVWVPVLCWVLLVVPGFWWLYAGIAGYRGPRNPMTAIWALNELAVFIVLVLFGIYLPSDWAGAALLNFALEGIYISSIVGAALRLVLVLLNPGGGQAVDPQLEKPGTSWLGRLRRY